jgi:hypothetical protein
MLFCLSVFNLLRLFIVQKSAPKDAEPMSIDSKA